MIILLIGLLGACMGSFAYAMTLRMHDGRDWVRGRSECENCHHALAWYDLVPLASWLSTTGKCRYCKAPMGRSYPIVELVAALAFAGSYHYWPYGFTKVGIALFGLWLAMLTIQVSLTIFDLKWYILPDKLVFWLIGLAATSKLVQAAYYEDLTRLVGVLAGVGVGAGIFFALYYFSRGKAIGFGDVKYGIFFGILLASPLKSLLVISLGSVIGTLLVLPSVLGKKTKLSSAIPFGPSLIAATMIIYIFGDRIVQLVSTTYLFP